MRSLIQYFLILFLVLIVRFPASGDRNQISFWTTEMETQRLEEQRVLAQAFTAKTGVHVRVIPVPENNLAKKITAATTGTLPDVLYHPADFTARWVQLGLLDVPSATHVVNFLGKETFGANGLDLVQFSGGYAAVPIDGWYQLLLYRKDLFKEKELPVPDNWDRILKAARTLHNPPSLWGFVTATAPDQIYTQQIFEHFALSNGARLTDQSGNIDLNTPQMIQTLKFYKALTRFTPRGNIHWLHTRKEYVSGRAAMIMWSPFILDELSGLRDDLPVVPDILKGKSGYLAKNTGFVSIIHGSKGTAQYSQINCLGITKNADKVQAKQWIKFLLTDGYLNWLGMAPEGKLPMRKGTQNEPDCFIKGWIQLEFGTKIRAKICEFYGMDVINTIVTEAGVVNRWGFTEDKGALVARIYETKVIPVILKQFLDGELSAGQAAQLMDEQVKALENDRYPK